MELLVLICFIVVIALATQERWMRLFNDPRGAGRKSTIKLGIMGRGAAGKTTMLYAIQKQVLYGQPVPGLEIRPPSTEEAKEIEHWMEIMLKDMQSGAVARTTIATGFRYAIFHGHEDLLHFDYRDGVGQYLSMTRSQIELQKEDRAYGQFKEAMGQANVVWVVLPLYGERGNGRLSDRDVAVMESYLRDAIRGRADDSKVSVALCITKADLAGQQGALQTEELLEDRLNEVKRRFGTLVQNSYKVHACSIFPVSTYGWKNVQPLEVDNALAGTHSKVEFPSQWNVDRLLIWSLTQAIEQSMSDATQATVMGRALMQAHRLLSSTLGRHPGPELVLKQGIDR